MTKDLGPSFAHFLRRHEEPHVATVGLAEECPHVVGAFLRGSGRETLLEVTDGQIGPPEKVGQRSGLEERGIRRTESLRGRQVKLTATTASKPSP